MIRNIKVSGKNVEVCKIINKNKKSYNNKKKENVEIYIEKLINNLLMSKQLFESELLKIKLKYSIKNK